MEESAKQCGAERILREIPGLSELELIVVMNALSAEFQARFMEYAGPAVCCGECCKKKETLT